MNKEITEILQKLDTEDPIRDLAVNYIKSLEKELDEEGIVFFLNLSRLIAESEVLNTKANLLDMHIQENLKAEEEEAETNAFTGQLLEAVNPPQLG